MTDRVDRLREAAKQTGSKWDKDLPVLDPDADTDTTIAMPAKRKVKNGSKQRAK